MGNSVQKDFADYTQAFFGGPTKKGVRYNQAKVGQTQAKVGKSGGEPQPRRGKAVPLPRSDNFTYAARAQRVVGYGEPIDGPAARKKAERKIQTQMKNDPKPKKATVSTKKTLPPAGKFDEKVMPKSSELAERVKNCLSRFTRCYAMDRKNYESTEKAMATFCKEFAALGHLPRRMLCDKGSELRPAYKIMG